MSAFLDIRPADRRPLLGGLVVLTVLSAAHGMLETARDTIFLTRLEPSALPWAYIGIAAIALLATRLVPRSTGRRVDRRGALAMLLACAAAGAVGCWGFLGTHLEAAPLVLYLFSGLVATVIFPRFWIVLGDVVTIGQAKRIYALVGAGSLIGAAAGSFAAGLLLAWVSARSLLFCSAGLFLTTAASIPLFGAPAPAAPRTVAPGREVMSSRLLLTQPYLRRLFLLVLATSAAVTLLDYLFKNTIASQLHGRDLGRALARIYATLNLVALVAQFAVVPLILRRLGIVASLIVEPLILFAGATLFAVTGSLWSILGAKVADGALRGSLGRVGNELLLMPLVAAQRERFKPVLEALGNRGGQALASFLILAVLAAFPGARPLALAAMALGGLWALTVVVLRPSYVELFRVALREGRLGQRRVEPPSDPRSIEILVGGLSSQNDEEVIGAMELLVAGGKPQFVPTPMIFHPSLLVARRSLQLLTAVPGRKDLAPAAARLGTHADDAVRAMGVAARAQLGARPAELEAALADPSAVVRATAIVWLLRIAPGHTRAQAAASEVMTTGSDDARKTLAEALAAHGDAAQLQLFLDRARDDRPELLRVLVRAARVLPSAALVPRLIATLQHREVRTDARQAILAAGPAALELLEAALLSADGPPAVRRQLPATIGLFASAEALAILARRLQPEPDGAVRFNILRQLCRLRMAQPDLPLDEEPLRAFASDTVTRGFELIGWRLAVRALPASPGYDILVELLREKELHALERLFLALETLHPEEDLRTIYSAIVSPDSGRHEASLEVLGEVLEGELRERILALVDDLPDEERLRRVRHPVPGTAAALAAMRTDHGFALPAMVAFVTEVAA